MSNHLKTKLLLAAFLLGAGAPGASAMSIKYMADAHSPASLPIVQVHSLHNNCQFNSVTPSGTGNPKAWHKTQEAGVHTGCTPPPRRGSNELTIQPRGSGNNSGKLKLSN